MPRSTSLARAGHRKPKGQKIAEAEHIYAMVRQGIRVSDIVRETGLSRATVYRRIEFARSLNLDPMVEEVRSDILARNNDMRRVLTATLMRTTMVLTPEGMQEVPLCSPAEVQAIAGRMIALNEQDAKISGAFAPTQVNHQHTVTDAFAVLMEEISAVQPVAERVPRV